ncbi:nucleoside deaminase [Nocardia sp. NPDC003345]
MTITSHDLGYLRRCVELAREALAAGDQPFGSLLADVDGTVLFEDRNRVSGGDPTRHPEFEISRWAAAHLNPEQRAAATVYTSGEHCVMCSASHGWVGLGRIVYAASGRQLADWLHTWGAPASPVATLAIGEVIPGAVTDGPAPELTAEMESLYRACFAPAR